MSSSHSSDDEDPLDAAALSDEAVTPRGGFMARPGLKSPPRHAVVVRGGDAPESEHIPLLRSSLPPPPPASEPAVPSASEKSTLRAMSTPPAARAAPVSDVPPAAPAAVESVPPSSYAPLSDAPLVADLSEAPSNGPASQRPARSRWTIVAAAVAGLVLGLASVAARVHAPGPAAQPQPAVTPAPVASTPAAALPSSATATARPPAAAPPEASPSEEGRGGEPKAARQPTPSAKRSIF